MKRFPEDIRAGMHRSGAAATCVPVRLDGNDWETAVFFQLAGAESKRDRRILEKVESVVPLGIETNLIEAENGAVVMVRLEVYTIPDDPLAGEVLLIPGGNPGHFEALQHLSRQPRLCWFFGDQHYWVIHSQQHPLGSENQEIFDGVLRGAIKHDALIRVTGRYDAQAALSSVVSHYELRAGVTRSEYKAHASTLPASAKH